MYLYETFYKIWFFFAFKIHNNIGEGGDLNVRKAKMRFECISRRARKVKYFSNISHI